MTTYNDVKDLKEQIRNNLGLVMSRVPENTRKEFIEFANGEFAGDYGMALMWYIQQANEYQKVKKVLLNEDIIRGILK
jgi:hypothetical protein